MNTAALPVPDADRKRRSRLAALFALRGYEMHELATGEILVCRWGLRRLCKDLAEAEDFARAVGALQ